MSAGPGGRARLQPCRKGGIEKRALALAADSAPTVAKAICDGANFAGLKPGASTAKRTILLQTH